MPDTFAEYDTHITPEDFAARMIFIQEQFEHNTESRHVAMDELMCEILKQQEYDEGVDIFNNTEKWYA